MIKKLVLAGRMAKFKKNAIATFNVLRELFEHEGCPDAGVDATVTLDGEPYELTFKRAKGGNP